MSSILQNMVSARHGNMSNPSTGRAVAKAKDILRMISILVMAWAVYVYHSQIFEAAQPIVDRVYAALQK